jgi:hypothetical protein
MQKRLRKPLVKYKTLATHTSHFASQQKSPLETSGLFLEYQAIKSAQLPRQRLAR